jgi:hypothetical protein
LPCVCVDGGGGVRFADEAGAFDGRLLSLSHARAEAEARLKFAEYRHVLYYQELVHLRGKWVAHRRKKQLLLCFGSAG